MRRTGRLVLAVLSRAGFQQTASRDTRRGSPTLPDGQGSPGSACTIPNAVPIGSRQSLADPAGRRWTPTGMLPGSTQPIPKQRRSAPDGKPCGRGTVGLLQRRPVIAGEMKLIGRESNRLEHRFTGLLTIDELDERLTVYHGNDGWRRFTLPKLKAMGSKKVADAVGISDRRARDVLKGRAMPHAGHRAAMERLATLGRDVLPRS